MNKLRKIKNIKLPINNIKLPINKNNPLYSSWLPKK